MAWPLPRGTRLCISPNAGESCARPAVTSHVAVIPCGAIGTCSSLNSRPDMIPFLASSVFAFHDGEPQRLPGVFRACSAAWAPSISITASIMPARPLGPRQARTLTGLFLGRACLQNPHCSSTCAAWTLYGRLRKVMSASAKSSRIGIGTPDRYCNISSGCATRCVMAGHEGRTTAWILRALKTRFGGEGKRSSAGFTQLARHALRRRPERPEGHR